MYVQYAIRSRRGQKRANNEDFFRVGIADDHISFTKDSPILFAVADGMGGHPCGEIASKMACEVLANFLDKTGRVSHKELKRILVKGFLHIDEQIRLYTIEKPCCSHMGTTLSIILINGSEAVIAHVGDTRIYCLRDGVLNLWTVDHTFLQEMLKNGVFTTEMAKKSPHKNILTQVVGTDEPLDSIYTRKHNIFPGDRLLLSSDGLHDTVSFRGIELLLKEGGKPEETASCLLAEAILKGGQDDITLIVADLN